MERPFNHALPMLLLLLPSCYAHSAQPSPAEWLHLQQLREKAAAASPTINAAEAPDYTCSDGVKSTAETWKVSGTSLGGYPNIFLYLTVGARAYCTTGRPRDPRW